jgi:hypothetical protein
MYMHPIKNQNDVPEQKKKNHMTLVNRVEGEQVVRKFE